LITRLKKTSKREQKVPKKPITILEGILYGIGCGFGASVFVLVGDGIVLAKSGVHISLLLAALFILLSALNYSELITSVPNAGGVYNIGKEGVGGSFAFIIGFFLWISNISISAFSAMILNDTLIRFFPFLKQYNLVLIIGLIFAIGLIAFFAPKLSTKMLVVMTVILLALFALFIVFAFLNKPAPPLINITLNPVNLSKINIFKILQTFGLLIILYKGILLNLAHLSPELRKPSQNVPFVNIGAVIASAFVYFLIFEAVLFNVNRYSTNFLLSTDNLMADIMYDIIGGPGSLVMYIALILSTIITINAGLSSATGVFKALVRDGYFSKTLFIKDPKKNEFSVNVILVNILVGVLFILIIPSTGFTDEIISFIYFFSIAFINFAAVLLRYRRKELDRPFRAPLFPILPITVGFTSLFLAFILSFEAIILGIFIAVLGLLIYLLIIADRHSKIITLSAIKLLSIIMTGIFIWFIKNLGVVSSNISGGVSLFLDIFLRILIFFSVFGFLTVFIDLISIREIINFFVKRFKKEKVAIKIGDGEIIEMEKKERSALYSLKYFIGFIEVLGALFTFLLIYLLAINFISIDAIDLGTIQLNSSASDYLLISFLLIFGIAFLLGGMSRIYYTWETIQLNM
jgi:APA family basic amino acid/polyamine antiporter